MAICIPRVDGLSTNPQVGTSHIACLKKFSGVISIFASSFKHYYDISRITKETISPKIELANQMGSQYCLHERS